MANTVHACIMKTGWVWRRRRCFVLPSLDFEFLLASQCTATRIVRSAFLTAPKKKEKKEQKKKVAEASLDGVRPLLRWKASDGRFDIQNCSFY